jgi:ADP-ribosyl-[dinitrogen reductase] hydrolase
MDRFVSCWKRGTYSCTGRCLDIGITTRQSLARYMENGDPYADSAGDDTAGNGSLMRLSPVALHALHHAEETSRIAAAQSRTTHAAAQSVEACVWFGDLLRRAIWGEPKTSLFTPEPRTGHPSMKDVASGSWRNRSRAAIRSWDT